MVLMMSKITMSALFAATAGIFFLACIALNEKLVAGIPAAVVVVVARGTAGVAFCNDVGGYPLTQPFIKNKVFAYESRWQT